VHMPASPYIVQVLSKTFIIDKSLIRYFLIETRLFPGSRHIIMHYPAFLTWPVWHQLSHSVQVLITILLCYCHVLKSYIIGMCVVNPRTYWSCPYESMNTWALHHSSLITVSHIKTTLYPSSF
jgi:hypothetical protein